MTDLHDTASKRQRYVLILAERARERGVTVAELRDGNLHHGRISSALSILHRVGKLCRLSERRDRCRIYVLPEYVDGRRTEPYGVIHKTNSEVLLASRIVEAHLRRTDDERALFDLPPDNEELANALWALVNYAQGRA